MQVGQWRRQQQRLKKDELSKTIKQVYMEGFRVQHQVPESQDFQVTV